MTRKQLFIFLLAFGGLFFASARNVEALINRVQYQTGSNAGANTISLTLNSAPTNGNALVMVIGTRGTITGNVANIIQNGATWVKGSETVNSNGITCEIWYALNVSSADTAMQVNLNSSLKASCIVAEYSGILTSSAFENGQGITGSGTSPGTPNVSTAYYHELWIGGLTNIGADSYSAQTNGFSEVAESASTGGSPGTRNNAVFEEKIVTSSGSAQVSATLSGSQQWAAIMAIFKGVAVQITGNAYSDEATPTSTVWSQCDGSTANIGLSVSGGAKTDASCASGTGMFSFVVDTLPYPQSEIAVFLDPASAGDKGVTYTRSSTATSPISTLKITKNRVRIHSEFSGSVMNNSDINIYDKAQDSDIPADADVSGNLTVDSGVEIHVETIGIYYASGTTTAANLHIQGSFTGASSILIITGSGNGDCTAEPGTIRPLCISAGVFSPPSTTIFSGTSDSVIQNTTYNNLQLQPSGAGSPTYTLGTGSSQTITCNGDLIMGDGANAVTVSTTTNSPNITVAGNLTVNSSATFSGSGSGTVTVNGGGATGNGAINLSDGTFLLDGAGNFGGATTWNFNNLTIGNGSGATTTTTTGTGDISVSSAFAIAANQTLDAGSKTWNIGGNFTNNGGFTPSNSTVVFNNAGKVSTLLYAGSTTFYNLSVATPSKEAHFDNVDQTNVTGTFNVDGGACGTKVLLRSDSADNQFEINAIGTKSVQFADIKDSNAIAAITANNSASSGNNSGWTINVGSCGAGAADVSGGVDLSGGVTITTQ